MIRWLPIVGGSKGGREDSTLSTHTHLTKQSTLNVCIIFFIHKTKTSCEIQNEPTKAEMYMKEAATCAYATGNGIGDYMTSCAKVHCKLRGWIV